MAWKYPGIEAEITALPTDNWQIFAALGWQSAEYQQLTRRGCVTPNESLAAYDANCSIAEPKRSPTSNLHSWGPRLTSLLASLTVTPNVMARYIGAQYSATRNQGYNEFSDLDQRGGQAVSGGLTVGAEFRVQELWG